MKKNVRGRKKVEKAGGSEDENNLPGGGDVNQFIKAEDGGTSATTDNAAMEEEKIEDEFLIEANAN
eukprot:10813721-Ditylum_brightwellii.AAC.1